LAPERPRACAGGYPGGRTEPGPGFRLAGDAAVSGGFAVPALWAAASSSANAAGRLREPASQRATSERGGFWLTRADLRQCASALAYPPAARQWPRNPFSNRVSGLDRARLRRGRLAG